MPLLTQLIKFTAQFTFKNTRFQKSLRFNLAFYIYRLACSTETPIRPCNLEPLYAFSRLSPKPKSYKLCSIKTNVRYLTPKCPSSILQASQINPNTILFCCFLTETERHHWTNKVSFKMKYRWKFTAVGLISRK